MNKKKRNIKKKKLAVFLLVSIMIFLVILFNQSGKNFDNVASFDSANEDYKCPDCNVILIIIDALRPDHLGCYGYEKNTSPNIDRLAEQGILFKNAFSSAPFSGASIASLMTSLAPYHLYVCNGCKIGERTALAMRLRENGFITRAVVDNGNFAKGSGFERGFEEHIEGSNYFSNGSSITKIISDRLQEDKDQKFFYWIHYIDVHAPYVIQKNKCNHLLSNIKSVHIPISETNDDKYGSIPKYAAIDNITNFDYYMCAYDEAIKYIDEQIGRLTKRLHELGLINKTIIIISADHGESMGEHNIFFTHGFSLNDVELHVPLIVKNPKLITNNKIVNDQVRLIDIGPTILDILEIRINEKLDGISLVPFMLGKSDANLYVVSRVDNMISIRTDNWKYISYSKSKGGEKIYNIKEDPMELDNLINRKQDIAKNLRQKLFKLMTEARNELLEPEKFEMDEELIERLRSLGYLQ